MRPFIIRNGVNSLFRRRLFTSSILKNIQKQPKIDNKPSTWDYFRQTKKYGIALEPETIKDEKDLTAAVEEYKEIMADREKKGRIFCKSCGSKTLQSTDSTNEKYFQLPKVSLKLPNKSDGMNLENLDDETLEEMGLSRDESLMSSEYFVKFESKKKEMSEKLTHQVMCKRCQNLQQHGIYSIHGCETSSVMTRIPDDATVVNVVSFFDFPLSCDRGILKNRDPKSIYYAVTKADVFYRKEVQIERTGLQYARDVLKTYMDADPAKVFLVSSIKAWDIKPFVNALPDGDVYFVGRANSGKSTLIKSIIASQFNIKLNDKVVKKIEDKKKSYLANLGVDSPGTYYIPGFTKDFQKFSFKNKYNLYDTPGFFPQDGGIYKYMLEPVVRKKPKYPQFSPEQRVICTKLKIKGPKVFNGVSMYSYGGFFYLVPPRNFIMKTCLAFNRGEAKFESRYAKFSRAEEINRERPLQIGNRFGVKIEAYDKLVRYVIPPFYGNIDIVIQDLGFFTIQPTSSVSQVNGLLQLYVPEGTRVIIRESIFKYAYKTHDKVDETGNTLRKDNIARRGATVLKSIFDEEKLHFSELIPVDKKLSKQEAFAEVCPVDDMTISEENAHKMTQEDYPNQYWRKLKL